MAWGWVVVVVAQGTTIQSRELDNMKRSFVDDGDDDGVAVPTPLPADVVRKAPRERSVYFLSRRAWGGWLRGNVLDMFQLWRARRRVPSPPVPFPGDRWQEAPCAHPALHHRHL